MTATKRLLYRESQTCIVWLVLIVGCIGSVPSPSDTLDSEPSQKAPGLFYSYNVGDYYNIYVGFPKSYHENKSTKYPVIYLLDADWYFYSGQRLGNGGVKGIVSQLIEKGDMPEVLIVGIGYPTGTNNRARDFVTSYTHFYKFLKDELIPFIDQTYNTSEERTLIGHSSGGFFTLYAFFRYPDHVFTNYIAISGDYNRLDRTLFTEEISLSRRIEDGLPVTLYMAVGQREEERFITSNSEMAEKLESRGYTKFRFKFIEFRGLDHGTVVGPAVEGGLKWIFSENSGV